MPMRDIVENFETGCLFAKGREKAFGPLPWNAHPTFAGVYLKHLVIGDETNGAFSYHLVRIDPGMSIGEHIHDPQLETHEVIAGSGHCRNDGEEIVYAPGTMTIFPARVRHLIAAGDGGLVLLAKFMPALC